MSDNPYEASATRLTGDPTEQGEVVLASRFKRLVARIVDGIFQTIVFLLVIYFIPSLWDRNMGAFGTVPEDGNTEPLSTLQPFIVTYDFSLLSIFEFLLATAVIFAIQGYFLAQYGQTIGKMALNVKIVDHTSHEKPSLTRLFVIREVGMNILNIVPLLGFIEVLSIFGTARRCLHDYWSQTIVVKAT